MRLLSILIASVALTCHARGQGPSLDPTPTPSPMAPASAPPMFAFRVSDAASPARFQARMAAETPAPLLSLTTGAARGASAFASLLHQADATQWQVVQAMATRAAAMTLDQVATTDVDVLTAALSFAAQDPRYPEIDAMSDFGVQVSRLKAQIAVDGLTAAHKAALISAYRNATESLKAFLATEAASASR